MLIDGLTDAALQALVITTIKAGGTLAGDRVFVARDWPTKPELFPLVMVFIPRESKEGLGPNLPQFTTTFTVVVVARVVDERSSDVAEASLRQLKGQIESALFGATSFTSQIQEFVSAESSIAVSSEGRNWIAELGMTLDLQVLQTYGPNGGVPLVDIQGSVVATDVGTVTLAAFDWPQTSS